MSTIPERALRRMCTPAPHAWPALGKSDNRTHRIRSASVFSGRHPPPKHTGDCLPIKERKMVNTWSRPWGETSGRKEPSSSTLVRPFTRGDDELVYDDRTEVTTIQNRALALFTTHALLTFHSVTPRLTNFGSRKLVSAIYRSHAQALLQPSNYQARTDRGFRTNGICGPPDQYLNRAMIPKITVFSCVILRPMEYPKATRRFRVSSE
ncbi:hypothetical protein BXZ70DRAFT_909875 [Cristinia sonorae]|uniref:Uncharacterized protein n=1 Tax=Cristinia sonorae TaxID=1940300 RepID=A0A8K0UJ04_9AGAR|nr:hypothetical protein BXZ70DRAFT_909875 [Cristinia sonorae]